MAATKPGCCAICGAKLAKTPRWDAVIVENGVETAKFGLCRAHFNHYPELYQQHRTQ